MVEMPVAVASSVLSPSIKGGIHDRDPFSLEKVQELLGRIGRGEVRELGRERREGIDHQATRMVLAHLRSQRAELVFDVGPPRARRIHLEQAGLQMRGEPNAHRSEISNDLSRAFVEAHVQRALAALAGGGGEESGQRRLGGSRRAGDEDVAAAVVAAMQHVVETREAPTRSVHR